MTGKTATAPVGFVEREKDISIFGDMIP